MAERQGYDDYGADQPGDDMGAADDYGQEPEMAAPAPEPVVAAPEPEAPATASFNEKASDLKEQVSNQMNSAASSLKDSFAKFDNKRAMSIVLTTLAVTAAAAAVAVALWFMMKKVAIKTTSVLLPESKVPLLGGEYKKLEGADIPRAYNGKRMTYSFWVYIHDVDRYKGIYRHIWHRGNKNIGGASPLVFLDKDTNRMHIRFEKHSGDTPGLTMNTPYKALFKDKILDRASGATASDVFEGTITLPEHALELDLATNGITLDYIPLQRWVHVALVVNEEINGGMIYAYLDGELVKQEISGRTVVRETVVNGAYSNAPAVKKNVQTTIKKTRKYSDLNLDKPGDVYTGGSSIEDVGPGFSGLVASISFYNFDLNATDIYSIYSKGPVDNLAAKLGLPAYGVRSPVYRM